MTIEDLHSLLNHAVAYYIHKKYFKGFKSEFPELVSNISKYFKIFGFIVCRSGGFQGQQHQADLHIVQHCAGFIVQDCAALVVLQSGNDAANGVAKISRNLQLKIDFFLSHKISCDIIDFSLSNIPFLTATQEDLLPFDIQFGLRLFCIE